MSRLHVICSAQTEMGRRSTNDDCVLADEACGLYLICDGARGRFGGRTAAELAIDTVREKIDELAHALGDRISAQTEQAIEGVLLEGHRRILAAQAEDPSLEGMTTTAAAVITRGPRILVSHVGDSRVYLHRGPDLQLLTRDHNLENYIQENPGFRPKVKYSGKTLVRALGLKTAALRIDHSQLDIQKDDLILISTDGLTDSVPGLTVHRIMSTVTHSRVEDVAQALVRSALNHGSTDNVSLVLLHVTDKIVDGPRTICFEVDSPGAPATKRVVLGWLAFLGGVHAGRVEPLEASTVIGADPNCKIVVQEDYVSSRHAEVLRTEHGFLLRDLGSTNGTFINNVRAGEEPLVDGDVIRVGTTEMIFKSHPLDQ